MNETKSCWRCVLKAVSYLWLLMVHVMAIMGLLVFITLGESPFIDALWLDEEAIVNAYAIVAGPFGVLYLLWSLTGPREKPKA